MKIARILSFVFALVMISTCFFTGCTTEEKMKITMWVSTTEGVKAFTLKQVEAFKEATGYDFDIEIETVGEGDAAGQVLSDLKSAPDIYWFAQDQLPRLVLGNALAKPGNAAADTIRANNDPESVNAASVSGTIYAYPLTSDNGYFLYYDKSVITDPSSVESIIEACANKSKYFAYEVQNAWIMASYFFAQPVGSTTPLCNSTWEYSADGKNPVSHADTFNSDNGLIAMRGLNALTTSGVWVNTQNDFSGTAAVVSGIWNYYTAVNQYGDNLGIAKLPTFTVDGTTYQLGSYKGCKLIGVKPQTDDTKAQICAELAMYLTTEQAQLDRHYEFAWGPSNKNAQQVADIKEHPALNALAAQNVYAQPQGVIPGEWWAEAGLLGEAAHADGVTLDTMKAALEAYQAKIDAMLVK